MLKDPEGLMRLLAAGNPWWDGEVPPDLAPPFRRSDFQELSSEMTARPILALAGPRQVGKTTVMYQLIQEAIGAGTDPRHILFVSFDLPGMGTLTDDPLNDSLQLYAERILGTPWRELRRALVFLDEVTKAPNWHRDLKGWFDLRYRVKFVVSDSSLTALRRGTSESLVGRVSTHVLLPWKFADVLRHRAPGTPWEGRQRALRAGLEEAVARGAAGPFLDALRKANASLAGVRARIQGALERYLLIDGYPELLGIEELSRCARRLREYLDLTLARDLYRQFALRRQGAMENLLELAAKESGQRISYRGWAETLGIQERTLRDYLEYLEGAHLVSQASFYSRSRAARIRKQRKVYVPNPGLRNALLGRVDAAALHDPQALGPSVESVVHDHARRLASDRAGGTGDAFYWRDRRGREVDIVVELRGRPLPIEVKHRGDPTRDVEGIRAFLQSHRVQFGLVVSRDRLGLDGDLLYVPLDLFLLTV